MKVVAVDVFKHWATWCNWLFVRISTDEGLTGWGEGSLHGPLRPVEAAVEELSPLLLGQDPAGPERHWQRLYHAWRWRGGPVQQTAISALDIALWDLEGKRLGVPVYRLLGGPIQTRFRAYASHWLQGVATPAEAAAAAREAVDRGFTAFKWSPFGEEWWRDGEERGIQRAAELMEAARSAVGPEVEIFIECGERLTPRTAVRAAEVLGPYRPGWFEEPVAFENPRAMARLQHEIKVPIATGERLLSRWQFEELLVEGGCKIVQPDVMHTGGITEARKIAALADTWLVGVAPHNPAGPISMLAAMHLMASIPNALILEQMEGERELRDSICTHPIPCSRGHFELTDRPGLGTDLDLTALEDHPFRPQPVRERDGAVWR